MVISKKKHYICFSLITAVFAVLVWYAGTSFQVASGVFWHRFELMLLAYVFLSMHCFLDILSLYRWIYKHRVLIAIGLLIFCVANCFTGSSVSMYDSNIQPNYSSEYSQPIFGTARAIRSDEWWVTISRIMAGSYNDYGSTNSIVRGVTTSGISATGGLCLDYSALRTPDLWGYYLFGAEYGNSFSWSFKMIFGFLIMFELCMILTKGKKLYSTFGGTLIWLSTFNMWWSVCTNMMYGVAIIVFFYYTLTAKNWEYRLLHGVLLAISGSAFCTDLYPAWQVPIGLLIIALFVWMLIDNQEWKHYSCKDWIAIIAAFIFMCSIILRFLYVDGQYLSAVSNTLYPGSRVSYGGFALSKLLGYVKASLSSFFDFGNASEIGTFFAVFPLGLILPCYVQWKEKGSNKLIWCLFVPIIILAVYTLTGLPSWLAKILFLTYSTPSRAVDILGFGLVLLLIVSFAEMDKCGRIRLDIGIIIALCCVIPAFIYANAASLNQAIAFIIILLVTALCIVIFVTKKGEKLLKRMIVISTLILMAIGATVNPITVGFSAITEKPVYSEVTSIIDSSDGNTLWIGVDNMIYPDYLIACGAPTLNSTNYVPNHDMWKILDPDDENEYVWNRYAHISITLSDEKESSYVLTQADLIAVELSKDDFLKLGINYVLGVNVLPESYEDILEPVYSEDGAVIYKLK
jgi:hypothetical protein